jgi:hypothetical protein
MLSEKVKESLMLNWGSKAESMNCYAEVKLSLEECFWHCYIYAIDPEDEDKILCITQDPGSVCTIEWSLKELFLLYDLNGEPPVIDDQFRRTRASELFKRLSEGK